MGDSGAHTGQVPGLPNQDKLVPLTLQQTWIENKTPPGWQARMGGSHPNASTEKLRTFLQEDVHTRTSRHDRWRPGSAPGNVRTGPKCHHTRSRIGIT